MYSTDVWEIENESPSTRSTWQPNEQVEAAECEQQQHEFANRYSKLFFSSNFSSSHFD